jgi:hypothetical protein
MANGTRHASVAEYPQGDSNPCYRTENPSTSAENTAKNALFQDTTVKTTVPKMEVDSLVAGLSQKEKKALMRKLLEQLDD